MRACDFRTVLLVDFLFNLTFEEVFLKPLEPCDALDLDALAFERDVLHRLGFVDPDRRIVQVALGFDFIAGFAFLQEAHEFCGAGVAQASGAITRGRGSAEPALPVARIDEDLLDVVGGKVKLRNAAAFAAGQ